MSSSKGREFRAVRIHGVDGSSRISVDTLTDDDLPWGDVEVDVFYSDLNFKDGKVMEAGSSIPQHLPIVPGIDFVGTVTRSSSPLFAVGDEVVANGFGLGTDRDGGLTQRTRVPGAFLLALPSRLDQRRTAAIGTAGYTAGLAVEAILEAGVRPSNGPVLVTGAGGGVGTIAIAVLAQAGFDVVASTGRADQLRDSLLRLGAREIIDRLPAEAGDGLATPAWSAVVDSVGSTTLASALAATRYGGVVAAVGLAQGTDLPSTVLPFILRGVSLVGIDSVYASECRRRRAWDRLANVDHELLDSITSVVGLEDAASVSQEVVAGRVHGRVVVDVHK
ncbi:acryloyl-CoA reductase [Pseudonocardia kujensis]|uniref:acrylyl-CoA reductase family protein n=1 Tax=Pseudonocardia kujensis TaxID=1128675 RepID=UPI001E529A45|nr:acryloyl-CoA reductase [Pseudonocardia kujensis]MCE0762335.1 acryloyl-CoA reductase [Pseudonocardia kujensis]